VTPDEAAREWANRKITNTAKNPPKTTKEELVPKLVAKDPNAIGYVSASVAEGKEGIKVIMTLA
jgi:ABC-type phosphate transport system substrate-binding protein